MALRRGIPYAYRPGRSPLHRLSGGIKLLGLLVISTTAFIFGPPALGIGTLAILTGALTAGIRPGELLRGIRPLLIMILLVTLCRSLDASLPAFNPEGFAAGLLFGWGILLSFTAASLLFSVTTMTELKDSLERFEIGLLSPLCLILEKIPPGSDSRNRRQILIDRLKRPRLSLGISLMLGFIPRFFAVWDTAELAYRARGGKPGAAQMALLLPLVIERMIEGAMETAAALESRGCSL